MMQGTYTAALGIASQQQRLDTIANNLANLNTNGFKGSRVDFKDALYSTMTRVMQPQNTVNMQEGHGTLVSGVRRSFAPGQFIETGRDTDFYLDGEGFFTVQSPTGETYYTRDGNFFRSVQGDGEYLVTAQGYYVLNSNGQRIRLQGNGLNVSPEGYLSENGAMQSYDRLRIVTFPNQQGLTAVSNNLFSASASSGQPAAAGAGTTVVQKALEGSNVNMADEFARLIRGSRALQLSSRALSTADAMEGTANDLRR